MCDNGVGYCAVRRPSLSHGELTQSTFNTAGRFDLSSREVLFLFPRAVKRLDVGGRKFKVNRAQSCPIKEPGELKGRGV